MPVKIDRKSVECVIAFFPYLFRGNAIATHSTLKNRNGDGATMPMKQHATECLSIFTGTADFVRGSAHFAIKLRTSG